MATAHWGTRERMAAKATRRRSKVGVTYDDVRAVACALPGVVEGQSYGTPALKLGRKLFLRLKEDGVTLVVRMDWVERQLLLRRAPEKFFLTEHYRDYPWVLVHLQALTLPELPALVEDAWRRVASRRAIENREQAV
jgi:hypothetical protein